MANDRTFYACQAIAVAILTPDANGNFTPATDADYQFIHGVQSVGLNTTFDFDNIFELGQLEIYDTIVKIPQVEITVEKVLDNHPTIYSLAAPTQDLLVDSKNRLSVRFAIYKDTENAGVSTPEATVTCTGMYINNVSYSFPLDGPCTESVTLVGNDKQWAAEALTTIPSLISDDDASTVDEPAGGIVLARKDVTVSAPNSTKVQSVSLSMDLGREDLLQLGSQAPYARVPTYPVEVTAEIECLSEDGDGIAASESQSTMPNENSTITVTAGAYTISLGSKCFLKSVAFGGGDASGGNATDKFSYSTYNTFSMTHTPVGP
jgi:hypothetical protein